jgi:hypothetical protein
MRAVGFALTGSDDAQPKAIDRAKCVFAIGDNIYRLNNVHTDRLKFQGWQQRMGAYLMQWITVELHGDDIVFEQTTKPLFDDVSNYTRVPHHYTYKQTELHLDTGDQDRVMRAWQYLYSHGCIGKQSPF